MPSIAPGSLFLLSSLALCWLTFIATRPAAFAHSPADARGVIRRAPEQNVCRAGPPSRDPGAEATFTRARFLDGATDPARKTSRDPAPRKPRRRAKRHCMECLDCAFEGVGKVVSKWTEDGKIPPDDGRYKKSASGCQHPIGPGGRPDAEGLGAQIPAAHRSENPPFSSPARDTQVLQHPQLAPLALKNQPWKQLENKPIDPRKLNTYREHLKETGDVRLVLCPENREFWRQRRSFLASDEEYRLVLANIHAVSDDRLAATFKLYHFLIERALKDQAIWWSEDEFKALVKECKPDDVNLTIRIGDLMNSEHPAGDQLVGLFKQFDQYQKPYNEMWSTGPGKIWLNEMGSQPRHGETQYQKFIKSLVPALNQHSQSWKFMENGSKVPEVPLSLEITWLDLGFKVGEMEELWYILEAYRTRNVEAAYARAVQGSKADHTVPLAYSDKDLSHRFVSLYRSLSREPKKRRLMLKWMADNVYRTHEIDEALLNIGKYAGVDRAERIRFSMLLCIHELFHALKSAFLSVSHWFKRVFASPKNVLSASRKVA